MKRQGGAMIPDYQKLMLPLLQLANDGREHRMGDVLQPLAKQFGVTEDEQAQTVPKGRQTLFYNRVHWAKTYLAQASLLEITRRAHFQITERGREVIRENPDGVNIRVLEQFPEFKEFRQRALATQTAGGHSPSAAELTAAEAATKFATPDEILHATIADIEAALSSELLDRILASPPAFFENLIVKLLLSMKYGGGREEAGRAIGKSGDGGIDGVIDQDPLGLDRVYLQAKRYKLDLPVSEPEVRAFSGSLGAAKATKGFTGPACEFAERHPIKMVLIDGPQLAALMIQYNVGVRSAETLHVKKVDEDFFDDD
jgi:restriction system protein